LSVTAPSAETLKFDVMNVLDLAVGSWSARPSGRSTERPPSPES